jgi:hypothetical protein
MANFLGNQSLNGLQTTTIFTAPAAGAYFIQGYLTLPQLSTAGAVSQVVAVVKQNSSTELTGTAGASGFAIPAITAAAGDVFSVVLSSSAAPDQVTNAVQGQVYFGNAF